MMSSRRPLGVPSPAVVLTAASAVGCDYGGVTAPTPSQDTAVSVSAITVDYDLSQPVFLNNRIPIRFELTGPTFTSTTPEQVAVAFNFVDPEGSEDEGCGSAAVVVAVDPSGRTEVPPSRRT